MWQSHAFHSPLLLFFHCLWFACQEELLFLLLLSVSRIRVTYYFTCFNDAVSLFKKRKSLQNFLKVILIVISPYSQAWKFAFFASVTLCLVCFLFWFGFFLKGYCISNCILTLLLFASFSHECHFSLVL